MFHSWKIKININTDVIKINIIQKKKFKGEIGYPTFDVSFRLLTYVCVDEEIDWSAEWDELWDVEPRKNAN